MKIIIEQLMEKSMTEDNEIIDTTEFYKKSKVKKSNKAPNYDPYILLGWYKHLKEASSYNKTEINAESNSTTIKTDTKNEDKNDNISSNFNSGNHKLILLIEDFECFDVLLLQDLISIFSGYSEELPIILLIGIATSLETFHQSLPISSLSLLQIEKFKLLQSYECINEIIEKTFIDDVDDFKLGIKPYQYLLDNFNFLNLSVDSFIRGIKFSVMYHFYSNPLSVLSSIDPTSPEIDIILKSLTKRHLDEAKVLTFGSFKNYVNSIKSKSPQLVYKLLTDDETLKSSIKEGLIGLHNYHIKFRIGFKCLLELQKLFQSPLFKKSKRALYLISLQESLFDSSHVQLLIKRSKMIAYPSIKAFLEKVRILNNEDEQAKPLLKKHMEVLDGILKNFEKLDEQGNEIKDEKKQIKRRGKNIKENLKQEDDNNEINDKKDLESKDANKEEMEKIEVKTHENDENNKKDEKNEKNEDEMVIINKNGKRLLNKNIDLPNNKSIYNEVLNNYFSDNNGLVGSQRETKISKRLRAEELQGYDTMINDINQFISNYFRETLKCYKEFPYYEIIYYTESSKLKKSFSAQPRSVIHTALNYPKHYLNCQCCSENDHIIESSLHDTCIAYKLYLECGKLINLYDWFVAFGNIIKDKMNRTEQKEKELNKKLKMKKKEQDKKQKREKKKNEAIGIDDNDIIDLDTDNEISKGDSSNNNDDDDENESLSDNGNESNEDSDENEDENEFNEKEIQARFIRAISELQYFGFIKSTNRKVDHVIKLTWGSD
jgi:origin recognition complex subunit 3